MFGKPPITALQEYCAKKAFALPTYDFIKPSDGSNSFICKVEALNMAEYGYGRSKREAKHDAAATLIKAMKTTYPDIEEIPQAPHEATPPSDAVITLRDYCVQKDHPLPTFEIIQQAGPAEAPEYTAQCAVASIIRFGVANNKKGAKQKAALAILRVITEITNDSQMDIVPIETKIEDVEEERYLKFKTYRELTESKCGDIYGTLLCDRHNYFMKFYENLREMAREVLASVNYLSDKDKALDLLKTLKIEPKIKPIRTKNREDSLFIELNCEYDVVFIGKVDRIYTEILEYFKNMF